MRRSLALALLLSLGVFAFAQDGPTLAAASPAAPAGALAPSGGDGVVGPGSPRDGGTPRSLDQMKGDSNCDGVVNFRDINAFVTALAAGPAGWSTSTGCAVNSYNCLNDINGDGVVNFADINPLVAILAG